MKQPLHTRQTARKLLCLALSVSLALPVPAFSASLSLATEPLAKSTTTDVLPNLMFIMDSSGSMGWNYLPDWANDSICKNTDGNYTKACADQPLFRSPDFNGIYYNPAIRYESAVDANGTSKGSQTTWTSVKNDAYGIQSTASTDLVKGYSDTEWCTDQKDSNGKYVDCLRNDNYLLPGVVGTKTYKNERAAVGTGSGSVATGSPAAPATATRSFGPHYYRINPGEFCDSAKLTNCQPTENSTFSFPARLRWCTTDANAKAAQPSANSCQAIRFGSFVYARFPTKFFTAGTPAVSEKPAVPASATFDLSMNGCNNSKKAGISKVLVGATNILPSATSDEKDAASLADRVRSKIATNGYTFSGSGTLIKITAPVGAGNTTSPVTLERTSSSNGSCVISPMNRNLGGFTAAVPAVPEVPPSYYGSLQRIDIVSGSTYPRSPGRTDCKTNTASCTYEEEMTNFANWWTYYHTRMQAMKTSVSLAFKPIDSAYRIGFIDIQGNNYLPIDKFELGTGKPKNVWYNKLFSMNPLNGTPLRSALARVGRIYAGKKPVGSADPVQYSCQQNFALLTTDGYWNTDNIKSTNDGIEYYPTTVNSGSSVKQIDGVTNIGNLDGGTTKPPMKEGPTATFNTLADVAKYYYDTDLRDSGLSNCTGALGKDVCENNVFISSDDNNQKQHMTTFTLGLGVDGTLNYTSDYKTAKSGDFYNLTHGTGSSVVNWPTPVADSETAVDDLWHAAVNGGGTYFSAKDPSQLTRGLSAALAQIGAKLGAGAAAATSTLNPIPGDNFAYVASYTTVKWQGNLEARSINLDTGVVSENASWCAENVVAGSCPAPGAIIKDTSGGSTIYNCVTPNATADTCSGVLDGTNCKVEIPLSCTGTLGAKVGATSDSRKILMASKTTGGLVDFTYNNLATGQQAHFDATSLSQYPALDTTQRAAAAGANLVNFLRGQTGFEDRASNVVTSGSTVVDNRLYRFREATLGDAIESQPAFIGKPTFSYTDPGYSGFVTDKASRGKTVFLGANDGMLHAFNADTGAERWAYVPSMVITNMWKLADKNYATKHTNYVNGSPIIADVYDSTKAAVTGDAKDGWRTILVAGLNGGGRGFYALDITDADNPSLLWEIDSGTEANLGFSFSAPVITKKADGTWVVLFTSGYNNTDPGDGKGYLYVRNALTGAHISRIGTGVGSLDTPSGLGKIATWADSPEKNNTAGYTYGGDLQGNLWRFDINTLDVLKFAVLKDPTGGTQPITARMELGSVGGKRIIYAGTGKYLEKSDLEDVQKQSLYAIKDDNATVTLDNARTSLVRQTVTASGATRTGSSVEVDFTTQRGWYIDFPDSGERINVDMRLDSGTIITPTTVPSNTVCSPGGYGWLNYFNYLTGTAVVGAENNLVSQKFNAPIVGVNIFRLPNGKRITTVVTADNPTPEKPPKEIGGDKSDAGFVGKRIIWRELTP